jgi:predicted amidohydrolase YtcJ
VGKLGDFVVLSEDPLAVNTTDIKDVSVEMTVIGGDVVHPRA